MPRVILTFDINDDQMAALRSVVASPGTLELRQDMYFFPLPKNWNLQTESVGLTDALLETLSDQTQLHWAGGGEVDLKIAETLDAIGKMLRKKLGRLLCR